MRFKTFKPSLISVAMASVIMAQNAVAADAVEVTGVVEVEAGQQSSGGTTTSDIALATVELGIKGKVNDEVSAEIVLLYEDDGGTALDVDSAAVTYKAKGSDWSVKAGQIFLPFGGQETNLVSDPLTLDLSEVRESAVQLDIESGAVTTSVYLFNGDDKTNKTADDTIDNFGFKVSYKHEASVNVTAGLSYINDMGNIDGIQAGLSAGATDEYVAATALDVMVESGALSFIAEHIAASDTFEQAELAFGAQGAKPAATNIEVAYKTSLAGKEATFAVAQQTTDEASVLGLPETKTLLGLSMELKKGTKLAFEFSTEEDYAGVSTDNFVTQLAVEF